MIWGLQPGPLLFVEQKDFVWGLIASMYLGNIAGLIVVLTTVPLFAAILRIPFSIIAPIIIAICAVGAYTVHNCSSGRHDHADLWRDRVCVQETLIPAGANGAGVGSWRLGGKLLPPGDADLKRQPHDILVELAGRQHLHVGSDDAVLALGLNRAGAVAAGEDGGTRELNLQ